MKKFILAFLLLFGCKSINSVTGNCDKCNCYYNKELKTEVYTTYDSPPEYSGGIIKLYSLISKNIQISYEDDLPAPKAIVNIIIGNDGHVIYLGIFNKSEKEYNVLEREIIKALSAINTWIPAKCDGKNVVALLTLPFNIIYNSMFLKDKQQNQGRTAIVCKQHKMNNDTILFENLLLRIVRDSHAFLPINNIVVQFAHTLSQVQYCIMFSRKQGIDRNTCNL